MLLNSGITFTDLFPSMDNCIMCVHKDIHISFTSHSQSVVFLPLLRRGPAPCLLEMLPRLMYTDRVNIPEFIKMQLLYLSLKKKKRKVSSSYF